MATRYWVGGGSSTNWSATGNTNWSATSGGANNASVPGASDDVFFDAASGSGTAVMDTAFTIISLDCTGFTGTLTQNAFALTISGLLFKLAAGMTYTPPSSRVINFTSTSGNTLITTAGKNMGTLTFNGAGGTFVLQDALTTQTTLTLTNGTFDANDFAVTATNFSSSNSNTRVITMGNGTWTLNGSNSLWDTGTGAGFLTVTPESSTLLFSGSGNNRSFSTGGKSFNIVSITYSGSGFSPVSISGSPVIDTLQVAAGTGVFFSANTTITNTPSFTGTSATNPVVVGVSSSVAAGTATVTFTGGSGTWDWCVVSGITAAGSGSVTTSNSVGLGNSGITINGPSGGGVVGVIGG
jgi:hypothetical protein